jgi:hypothetical protein
MTLPFGGCPTGSLDIDLNPAAFSVGFAGTSAATWTYSSGQPGEPQRGSFGVVCGK